MADIADSPMFRSLEFKDSRTRTFGASVAVHAVLLAVLLTAPLVFYDSIQLKRDIVLIAPPQPEKQILEVTHYKPPPPRKAQPEPKFVAPPPVKPTVIEPPELRTPAEPKIVEANVPEIVEREKPLPLWNTPRVTEPEAAPAPPNIDVKTGTFSTGSSAKPAVDMPARNVQTGGFGDPNGIKGEGKSGKVANIASLGAFDLPAGAGAGNGTGGAKGVKGTVASAGFGNGVAPVGNGGAGGGGSGVGGGGRTVRQGGFADAEVPKPESGARKKEAVAPQTPVEILFKPRPDYTEEARKLKVEGEVLLRILFTAGGEVRVVDVVRGLGRGLDENAIRAAQQIRFKPAQRDGQPVDSTATVHILFQLAY